MSKVINLKAPAATACKKHPAYEADNCPTCGTAAAMGTNATRKVVAAAKTAASKATAKAPAKATKAPAKADAKAPAKAPAKAASKAPVKRGLPHPGAAWLVVLDHKGLSQSEAARQMGVAPMTLNRLLNGHGIPTAKVAVAFARVTEQKVEDVWQQVADYELALALAAATQ